MGVSTAPDHAGRFVFGRLAGQDVAVMQGRLHTYEGWSFADVSFPVRLLRLLGARTVIVTNAAGAVNRGLLGGGHHADHRPYQALRPQSPAGAQPRCAGPPVPGHEPCLYAGSAGRRPLRGGGAVHPPAGGGLHVLPRPPVRDPGGGPGRPHPGGGRRRHVPRCRRPSRPPTAAWRCWASPCAPTWPPACWTGPCPRMRCSPPAGGGGPPRFSALVKGVPDPVIIPAGMP